MTIKRALATLTTTAVLASGIGMNNIAAAEESSSQGSSETTNSADINLTANNNSSNNSSNSKNSSESSSKSKISSDMKDRASKVKVSEGSSKAERWFDGQSATVQAILIAVSILSVIGVLLGPLRVAIFNFFKI
ncbi:MAG: hypothetical protein Q4D85_05630 [Corynebacterium sp.]|uniref:hypothetical protein n=1 Tax=Corynebacterium sp. TaxID=1720 RepID=UPI0026DBA2F6|nr:hypothetical protein [Corynebacterium sp.]MDO5098222.1 hypothetical protein [Corynebacterium sp.]